MYSIVQALTRTPLGPLLSALPDIARALTKARVNLVTSYKLQVTSYKLQVTSYKLTLTKARAVDEGSGV